MKFYSISDIRERVMDASQKSASPKSAISISIFCY